MTSAEERLASAGINTSMLLSSDVTELKDVRLTNGIILDLHNFMNKTKNCTYLTYKNWIAAILGSKWPVKDPPTIKALRQSVIRLSSKLSKLRKAHNSEEKLSSITSFLEEEYHLPNVFVSRGRVIKSSPEPSSSSSSSVDWEKESLKAVNKKLCEELSEQSSDLEQAGQKLKTLQLKMHSKHRNNQKKIRRRDQQLKIKEKEVKDGKQLIKGLQKNVNDQETKIKQMKMNLDRLNHRAAYWKMKCTKLKDSNSDEIIDAIATEKAAQVRLSGEVELLESENLELRETVNELMAANEAEILTFEKGKYRDNIRSCCYELLSLNVGVRNIEKVIRSVLHNISGRSVSRLPSKTTLCEMMIESLTIAQAQLGEKLTEMEGDFFTLHTDGTTKHGDHFGTYDITTEDKTYHLGLRHIFSGSAQTTLDTFLEILDDLDTVCTQAGGASVSDKIMYKIKNTMSDRHAAEKLFCHLLADYRESILPDVVADWDMLSSDQRDQIIRMNNFFCGLHYLVGLAESAEATLALWETIDDDSQGNSSGTQRLIRTACKAFHSRGCEKSGCSVHFRTYLRSVGISDIPLSLFRGNRFNIIFYDGAGVYYMRTHFEKYLVEHHNGPLNGLLRAVLNDLRVPKHIAGCKALGIIDKLVTGPFWRKLESSTVSILDLSDIYSKMKQLFDCWGEDATSVIDNQEVLFPEFTNFDDIVSKELFQQSPHDALTQEALQLIFKSFASTTQRLVIDHLPGGQYHSVSDPQIALEVASVPTTNVAPERDFAVLDRLLSQKPNASYIALESLLLYSQNQTSQWLLSKSEKEKERLLSAARTLTSVNKANFKKRREEIVLKRLKAQKEREKDRQKKHERLVKEKEELTVKLAQFGLWTTVAEVERGLHSLDSKKKKQEALKVQISFRRKVLGQNHEDKNVFYFSHNRKPLTETDLKLNLLKLLPQNSSAQQQLAVPSETEIATDPDLLLYRRIKHRFECDGSLQWFDGTILSYNKDTGEYRVQYDNEDEIYSFPLLDDLKENDLKVLC